MNNRVQIGVEVDAEVWQRYRDWVESKHGKTRGVLGDEVENALRRQIGEEITPGIDRVEKRLARIENELGAAATDGGAATEDNPEHTHAPSRLDIDDKPPANAATEKKVEYLAECVLDNGGLSSAAEIGSMKKDDIVTVVKDEYGFRADTSKRYVNALIDHFELQEHPHTSDMVVSENWMEERKEKQREERRKEVDEKL